MSSEFTFGGNSDKSSIFFQEILMNLVDRDLTVHQITRTLTLSRLHAQLEQTRGIRLFNHTQHVDWSRQGIRLFESNKLPFVVVFCPMQCDLCESVE